MIVGLLYTYTKPCQRLLKPLEITQNKNSAFNIIDAERPLERYVHSTQRWPAHKTKEEKNDSSQSYDDALRKQK